MERFELELAMRLWRTHRALRRRDAWPRDRLVAHQEAELRRLRAHAYRHSAFYRRWHAGLEDRPLTDLPVMSKGRLLEVYDEAVTDPALCYRDLEAFVAADRPGYLHGRYVVVSTSGSSGRPTLFAYDAREWAWILASLGRGMTWAGLEPGGLRRRRVATVGSVSPWHMSARAGMTLPRWWLPTLRVDAAAPIEVVAAQLMRWQPDLLVTYGSLLAGLADAQAEGRMDIAPRAIVCGADALSEGARVRAREAWGTPVFEEYAATETAGIAAECEVHSGLHIYEDLLVVEAVDDAGQPVPVGVPAMRLLVTVLFARTLPLIRYELSDGVRLHTEACPCGRPFARITGVDGRVSETLWLRSAQGDPVTISPVVIHEVMDVAEVTGWQLLEEPDRLCLRVVIPERGTDVSESLPRKLTEALGRHGAVVPPIVVESVSAIERGPGSKVALIKPLAARSRLAGAVECHDGGHPAEGQWPFPGGSASASVSHGRGPSSANEDEV